MKYSICDLDLFIALFNAFLSGIENKARGQTFGFVKDNMTSAKIKCEKHITKVCVNNRTL